jgi:uncharacterized membrane protein
MVWMKLVHITAISIWSASLICLPGLYVQRAHVATTSSLHRLQGLVRFLYVGVTSPAAFVGIASGTALIFMRESYQPWFTAKLFFVGVLAIIHVLTGLVIIRLFEEGEIYPVGRFVAVTLLTLLTVFVILTLVLGKPELPSLLPATLGEPGGLRGLLAPLIPFPRS